MWQQGSQAAVGSKKVTLKGRRRGLHSEPSLMAQKLTYPWALLVPMAISPAPSAKKLDLSVKRYPRHTGLSDPDRQQKWGDPELEYLNTPVLCLGWVFLNLGRVEQCIGNGFAFSPTLRQPTTMSSEKQQFCFGNWHSVQACSWKWICTPPQLQCSTSSLPASTPFQLPLSKAPLCPPGTATEEGWRGRKHFLPMGCS